MAKKLPPIPPTLWKVRARSIHRKTRADQGAIGLWLVLATSPEAVRAQWGTIEPSGTWAIETVLPSPTDWARVF